MTHINQNIDDNLDKKFRDVVYKKYGMKKGSMLKGFEEAIELWIEKNGKKPSVESKSQKARKRVLNEG